MKQNRLRRAIDIGAIVLLLLLMAYQVTGEALHEWLGMGMTALVIVHQILNRRWYGAMLKGRYTAYRAISACVNALLLASFALTAFCGMAMSNYAVPFLYGIVRVSFVRMTHLSMSHWSFVLMGLHLGMHAPVMLTNLNLKDSTRRVLSVACAIIAGVGLWLFLGNSTPDYLFFKVPFAFLDYEKAGALVLLENVTMLLFWVFSGCQLALMLRKKGNPPAPVALVLAALVIGMVLNTLLSGNDGGGFDSGWGGAVKGPVEQAAELGMQRNERRNSPLESGRPRRSHIHTLRSNQSHWRMRIVCRSSPGDCGRAFPLQRPLTSMRGLIHNKES